MVLFLLAHGGEPDLPIGEFSRDYILSTAVQLDHWDMAEIIFRYCRPKNLPHQVSPNVVIIALCLTIFVIF
jgi:hypothetical protein